MPQGASRIRIGIASLVACSALAGVLPAASAAPPADLHTPAAMAATIHQLRGCLAGLPKNDRRLLSLRFGVGGKRVLTDAQVAAQVGLSPAQVRSQEIVGVRRLSNVHRRGGCRSTGNVASATGSPSATRGSSTASRSSTAATSPVAAGSSAAKLPAASLAVPHRSGGIGTGEAIALGLVFLSLALIGREVVKLLLPRLAR